MMLPYAEPSRLTPGLIRRWRAIEDAPVIRIRPREAWRADAEFFLTAWAAGFLFFLAVLA